MSLGSIHEPSMVFGAGKKNTRSKATRRAAIARWAMANREIGDDEIVAADLSLSKVKALRQVVADESPLAEHCDTLILRRNLSSTEIALSVSVLVDAINERIRSRHKDI